MGVEMKSFLAMASMLLFVFAAQGFGFAFGAEQAATNDSINEHSRMQLSSMEHSRMQLSSIGNIRECNSYQWDIRECNSNQWDT